MAPSEIFKLQVKVSNLIGNNIRYLNNNFKAGHTLLGAKQVHAIQQVDKTAYFSKVCAIMSVQPSQCHHPHRCY